MSLIPHNFFPRSVFDMDNWMKPNHLDLFDPFDELDHTLTRNLQWLNKPEFLAPMIPRVPQKYRITVDCPGYNPKSIKTEVNGRKLVVSAREEVRHDGEDFSIKEFKKTYELPENSESDKLVSFMTGHGHLVIEVPLKECNVHLNTDLFPKIVDTIDGGKQCQLNFQVPQNIDPSKVHVSIKDRDLIVKAEDKVEKPDGISRFYFYKRTTLPENTEFENLKCQWNDHRLSVSAPLNLNWKAHRAVPIEGVKQDKIEGKKM